MKGRSLRWVPAALFTTAFSSAFICALSGPRIQQVRVEGNLRVPAASILHHISTTPGATYDGAAVSSDLRKLRSLGIFRSLEVDTQPVDEEHVNVIFRVTEFPFVSEFFVEGVSRSLEEQIRQLLRKENLEMHSATPFNPALGHRAVLAVQAFLRAHKYPRAGVRLLEEPRGNTVRAILEVHPGPRLGIGQVLFSGNSVVSDMELKKQMQHTRAAPFWTRWSGVGACIPEALTSDLERVRRYYQSRGHAGVVIGEPEVEAGKFRSRRWFFLPFGTSEKEKLVVRVPVREGPKYELVSVRMQGDAKVARSEVASLISSIEAPSRYDYSLLESIRKKIVDALGRSGYALAEVQLEQAMDHDRRTVHAIYQIDPGDPFLWGEIKFVGNSRLPDKFLRHELVAEEGALFNAAKLDESISRLNRSGLLQELRRADVVLRMDEKRHALDVTFRVKEKARQGIYATGGTRGVGGNYLGMLYNAFNLLGLGEALSMQLDGGAAQSNLLVDIVGRHFLGTPFILGLSGFHRYTHLNVASIVPGPQRLAPILRRRSTGLAISGRYELTPASQFGLGFQVERSSISEITGPDLPAAEMRASGKSELTPSYTRDSLHGTGPAARGSRLELSQGILGSAFLGSVEAMRPKVRYTQYTDDSWTAGRNAFAFQVFAGTARAREGKTLALERRFFSGDELIRGLARGSLSPWARIEDKDSPTLRPAGADTVLGFSTEYRVPVRGIVSSAAFLDLGWSHLRQGGVGEELGKEARLVDETNGVLRASVGGEFRFQLPILRQPVRLIFAWNPLRLESLVESHWLSPLRLTDPRGRIRLALGRSF